MLMLSTPVTRKKYQGSARLKGLKIGRKAIISALGDAETVQGGSLEEELLMFPAGSWTPLKSDESCGCFHPNEHTQASANTIWHKCTEVSWKSLEPVHLFRGLETLPSGEEK